MLRSVAAIAILMTATSCGGSPKPSVSDAQLEEYGKSEVRKLLRDPDSAQFYDVHVSRKAGVPAICGYVNSNNAFGGKVGKQRFISGGATVLEEQMVDGDMDVSWRQLC